MLLQNDHGIWVHVIVALFSRVHTATRITNYLRFEYIGTASYLEALHLRKTASNLIPIISVIQNEFLKLLWNSVTFGKSKKSGL